MSVRLVKAPHTLHLPPSVAHKKDLVAFSKQHGLRNEYLKDVLAGKPRLLVGHQQWVWQSLKDVRWLRHEGTGELVVVVGGASSFLRTDRAKQSDMDFVLRTLQDHLQASTPIKSANGVHTWAVLPSGFEPPQILALSDGASLSGIFDVPVPTALQDFQSTAVSFRSFEPQLL